MNLSFIDKVFVKRFMGEEILLYVNNTRFSKNFEILQEGTMAMMDLWMHNFSRNINDILDGDSVKLLNSVDVKNTNNTAIVIGAGPSVREKHHLEQLVKSDYTGTIICTDRMLIPCLKQGITPDKFPEFYVVTIDPVDKIAKFYDDPILKQYGNKIRVILSTCTSPLVIQKCKQNNLKMYFVHPLIDDYRKPSSVNKKMNLMSKSEKNPKGFPGMQTGGNVGSSCWVFAWAILGRSPVALIGINFGYLDDSKISETQHFKELAKTVGGDEKTTESLYKRIFNPHLECNVLVDPVFDYYREAFCDLVTRTPSWVKTINATEGGSLFNDEIIQKSFKEFLQEFS